MNERLAISVVIINYNYEHYVRFAIESVLTQSKPVHQLIIVDDGSTDHSVNTINHILSDSPQDAIFITKHNEGMISAANEAFEYVTGDYVIFLDADDMLCSNCIESVQDRLASKPALLHYPLKLINSTGTFIGTFPNLKNYKLSTGQNLETILRTGFYVKTSTSGNAYRASALRELLPIEDHIYNNDDEYYGRFPLDAYLTNKIIYFGSLVAICEPLACYRMHDDNNGAGKTMWNSPEKRVRVIELMHNDIAFFSKKTAHSFDKIILRDPRLLLTCVIQNTLYRGQMFGRSKKITLELIWSSLKHNLFEPRMRLSHKIVIYSLILFIPKLPHRLITRFIR